MFYCIESFVLVVAGCGKHLIFLVATEARLVLKVLFWCFSGEVTPVLIPNTAVKLSCADGSRKARVGRRQNKTFNLAEGARVARPFSLFIIISKW